MYRQELPHIKVMCDDSNCHGECGLFHNLQRRAKSADVRSPRGSANLPRSTRAKESDQATHKTKRKKPSLKKIRLKEPAPLNSPSVDHVTHDEWAQLDEELHDQRHYFAPTTSVTNSLISLNSSEFSSRAGRRKTVVHTRDELADIEGAEQGKDNEWELLKAELIDKEEVDKARLFAAEELERERRTSEQPEEETTLDDIIEAARRKSVSYKPGNAANKRKSYHTLFEPLREERGSSVQAVLADHDFATHLLDSDEEGGGGIVGDPPSTISDDLDLEHLVEETKPPRDAFSNPIAKTADPLTKQLSRSRTKKKTVSEDEMSVDFSVVDLSVASRMSVESGYDDIDVLSSAVHAMATRTPDAEYVGSLF
uniref:Uncharacterized protein n=1 Tax=Plectus sambesii TaxID=2011161 RepID=A0A914UST2_9BILA